MIDSVRVTFFLLVGMMLVLGYSCEECLEHADCSAGEYCMGSFDWFDYKDCKAFKSRPCEEDAHCAGCEYTYEGETFSDFTCTRGQCLNYGAPNENWFYRDSVDTCNTELECDLTIEFPATTEISIQECEDACGVAVSNNDDGDFPGCEDDDTALAPVSDFTVGGQCCR